MITKITEIEALEMYDDFLDEVYGDADICGFKYQSSRALKEVDPTAYRCGFNDWLSYSEDEYQVEGY